MGFSGQTYAIPCNKGGFTANPNIDLANPQDMVSPSRNLNLNEGGRRKRGGTIKVNATAVSGGPAILGIYDFTLKSTIQRIILGTADGQIWKNFVDPIKTGWTINKYPSFEVFGNALFICNGANTPAYWDGTTWTDMTAIPSDWTGTNFPSQFIKHGFGNSERLWAVGCLGSSTTGYRVYGSKNGDAAAMGDSDVITLELNTPDIGGVVAAVEYGDRLICFSQRHAFIIDDTDPAISNWGYQAAIWEGGVAHPRLIVKTPSDVVCMMEDGEIYSIIAAENYGDYKAASLIRQSFLDKWIKENIDLSRIAQFHGVYDPVLRAIKYFVVRNGQTQVDTALVMFVDRDPAEAWMIHDNQAYTSGYSAASSAVIRYAAGDYRVYTGDYAGFVRRLETSARNDDGNGYYGGFRIPPSPIENPRITKRFTSARIICNPQGSYDMQISWWVDGHPQLGTTASMAGVGGVLDSFILDTDMLAGADVLDSRFELGQEGKRVQIELYNNGANQDFLVSNILVDFVPIGAKH